MVSSFAGGGSSMFAEAAWTPDFPFHLGKFFFAPIIGVTALKNGSTDSYSLLMEFGVLANRTFGRVIAEIGIGSGMILGDQTMFIFQLGGRYKLKKKFLKIIDTLDLNYSAWAYGGALSVTGSQLTEPFTIHTIKVGVGVSL